MRVSVSHPARKHFRLNYENVAQKLREYLANQKSWKEPRNLVARRPDKRTHKFALLLYIQISFPLPAFNQIMLYILTNLCARSTKYWKLCSSKLKENMKNVSRGKRSMDFSSREIKENKLFMFWRLDSTTAVNFLSLFYERWTVKRSPF